MSGQEVPAANGLPQLDIYVAGFPCQPWSRCGLSAGLKDDRGSVWIHIFRFIAVALPRAVVLDNVVGLMQGRHKRTFKRMLTLLESMEEYHRTTKCLNTKDYGVPQNRPRLYFVGIRRSHARNPFEWPSATTAVSPPTAVSPQLDDFLEAEPGPSSLCAPCHQLDQGRGRTFWARWKRCWTKT